MARGADVNARDAKGNMPIMMAVKACIEGVPERSGYDEVDELIAKRIAEGRNGYTVPTGKRAGLPNSTGSTLG